MGSLFGLCAAAPVYTGKAQPGVLAPSMMGIADLVAGFLKSPAPAYVGKAQRAAPPTSGLLCSFLSAPQPVYKTRPRRGERQIPSSPWTGAEGR